MYRRIFRQPYISIGLVLVDMVLLSQTDPNSDVAIVMVVIGLIVLTIWSLTSYVVRLYISGTQPTAHMYGRQNLITIIIAGGLSYVVLMQSIGQLNVADILALIPFGGLLFLYQTYGQPGRSRPFEPTKRS